MPPGQYVLANDAKNKTEKAFCLQVCAIITTACWLQEHITDRRTLKDFQTVYEGTYWCLFTVTFDQKIPKLNSRLHRGALASFLPSGFIAAIVVTGKATGKTHLCGLVNCSRLYGLRVPVTTKFIQDEDDVCISFKNQIGDHNWYI